MDLQDRYRLRVKNCIGTIIEVHKSISGEGDKDPTTALPRFNELRKALNEMDMSRVSEYDVQMVERATNELLFEFQPVFETEKIGPICLGKTH